MRDSRGFTLIELLVVVAIVGIAAAAATVGYRHVLTRGHEAAAIAALDAINQAQFAFAQTCGNQTFAPTLPALGLVPQGRTSAYLSPDLTLAEEVVKSGYRIRLDGTAADPAVETCIGEPGLSGYRVLADPVTPGISGTRFFATNADRVIFEDDEPLGDAMPERGDPSKGREVR